MLCSWFLEVEEELSESVKGMRGSAGEKEWQVARSEGEREGLDDVAGGRATRQASLMASARCQRAAFVANLDTATMHGRERAGNTWLDIFDSI